MPSFGQNLLKMRKERVALVNTAVGELRTRYITSIPGQDALYKAKQEEAQAYLEADPEPASLVDYPLLASEVGITAPTAYEVAQIILQLAFLWTQLAAQMEILRLGTIKALEESQNKNELDAVVTQFHSSLAAF